MPIGVETESLNIAKYNFLSDYITLITGEDETLLANFINSMMIRYSRSNLWNMFICFPGETKI